MISVIVSTKKDKNKLFPFEENIHDTIGLPHELIFIENHGKYSLAEAYNFGIKKSKFEYVVFLHDDILFNCENWGKRIVNYLEKDTSIGLVGVAGTKFKGTYPAGWGQSSHFKKFQRGHIYAKVGNNSQEYFNFDLSEHPKEIEEVICVDGVFLFTRKVVLEQCHFDEKNFTDFHGYDIDFSLQVHMSGYKVVVDRCILLAHYSRGSYNSQFHRANKMIVKKWKSNLPLASDDLKLSPFKRHYLNYLNSISLLKNAILRTMKTILH